MPSSKEWQNLSRGNKVRTKVPKIRTKSKRLKAPKQGPMPRLAQPLI